MIHSISVVFSVKPEKRKVIAMRINVRNLASVALMMVFLHKIMDLMHFGDIEFVICMFLFGVATSKVFRILE